METTVLIQKMPEDTWHRVKVVAAQQRKTVRDVVVEALEAYVTKAKKGGKG